MYVASLITRIEADHFDVRTDHVATVTLAHEVVLLVVECVVLGARIWSSRQLLGQTAEGIGVVVTPPLESARGLYRSTKASTRTPA